MRTLLDHVTTTKKGAHYHPAGGLDGLAFEAIDIDWRWGTGAEVCGPATDLALAVTDRPVDGTLTGAGVEELRGRRRV